MCVVVTGDWAIESARDDEFGREFLARRIAVEAMSASAAGGIVIGLCGPWGSGKTSVTRMAMEYLEKDDVLVVPFNPWMFSGHDDLVSRFFAELTTTMGTDGGSKFKRLAGAVADYASAVSRVVRFVPGGGVASEVAGAAGNAAEAISGRTKTIDSLYQELAKDLRELAGRIVVFIDDIDRLTDSEIRDIVRLVKSVGDLPNISYILAFDREHVELVLGGGSGDAQQARQRGRRYLEKIVQVRHDVPPPRRVQLVGTFLVRQLRPVLAEAGIRESEADEHVRTLQSGLLEMVQTPRDAKRLANAVSAGLEFHAGEVATVDLIGLEALRVLEPEVHNHLERLSDILFGEPWDWYDREKPDEEGIERRLRLEQVLGDARAPRGALNLLRILFPAGAGTLGSGRILKDDLEEDRANRVAVRRVFLRYVHASISDTEVSSAEMKHVAAALRDPNRFARRMAAYHGDRLVDLLARLPGYLDHFNPVNVASIGEVLLDAGERLPSEASPFRVSHERPVRDFEQLMAQLLFSQTDAQQRAADLANLMRVAPSLSARWQLLFWFGSFRTRDDEDSGSRVLSESETAVAMDGVCKEVMDAKPAALTREVEMKSLMEEAVERHEQNAQTAFAEKARSEGFLLTLIAVLTRSVTLIPGTEPHYQFDWNTLADLLGDLGAREAVIALDDLKMHAVKRDPRRVAGLAAAVEIARGQKPPPRPIRMVTGPLYGPRPDPAESDGGEAGADQADSPLGGGSSNVQ